MLLSLLFISVQASSLAKGLFIYISLSFTFMNISTITQTRNNEHENKIIGNPADSDKSYIIDYIKRKLSL